MFNASDYSGLYWWPWVGISPEERKPLSWSDEKKTKEEYDLPNSRSMLGNNGGEYVNFMRGCAAVNEGFVTGRLWGLKADYNSFLMDQGITNTRQPFIFPLSQTMNTRMLGQLSKISIQGKAEAVTQRVTSRRDQAMLQAKILSMAAQVGPEVASVMDTMGVTPDEQESMNIAEKRFQDPLQRALNSLLTSLSTRGKYDEKRKPVGQNVNVSGLGAVHAFVNGSRYEWEVIDSRYVFYDPNAKQPDLSDGSYCGFFKFWPSLSSLSEAFNIDKGKMKILEEALRAQNSTNPTDGVVRWPANSPVTATCYYKDGKYIKRGFIQGPNGPEIVSVDTINPDTGKPFYTDEDLIDPPESELTMDWEGKTKTFFYEVLRYCVFIPRELMPVRGGDTRPGEGPTDFVIAGGEYELREVDPDHEFSVKFPLKMGTWMNIGGFVVAPLTAVMSPQRIINQITSDIVWRMSQAGTMIPFFDKKAISSGNMTIKQALTAYKRGNPLYGDTVHIGGAQNAVQMVGGGLDPNIFKQWELLQGFIKMAEDSIGLYAQNSGAPGPANQLVGVKEI